MNYNADFPENSAVDLDSYFREQLVYFFFNFTKKCANSTYLNELSQQLLQVLNLLRNCLFKSSPRASSMHEGVKITLQNDSKNIILQKHLELFYRMIGQTREGKGEHDISYMLLLTFYDVFPTTLSTFIVSTSDGPDSIITADATFRYAYFDVDKLF